MPSHLPSCLLPLALAAALAIPSRAGAEDVAPAAVAPQASEWAGSLALSGGTMVSDDQRQELQLGAGGGSARLGVHARPFAASGIDWLEGELRAGFTIVGPGTEEPGGLVDVQLGLRLSPSVGAVRPYLAIGFGLGLTGPLARPLGSVVAGVAIPLGDELSLAPEVSLLHVLQDDGDHQSDDALFVSFGLALTFRPTTHAAPEPEVQVETVETVTVVERDRLVLSAPVALEPMAMADLLSLVDRAVPGSSLSVVLLVPPVLFDHDDATLTAAGEVAMHDVLDRVEDSSPTTRVVIEGHADQTGDAAHNLTVSRARAAAVGRWLVQHGVPRARIRETGEGATAPLVVGEDATTLAPNRRVTIRLETDRSQTAQLQETP